ncbi:MAG: S-adenosylmethionine synthase [Firmicutes bacterium ADurb.Bin080]|jgi:S-adenosylmethionine synthetase|nr:methionine adenosyltransferase [Clostridiales bacterium]OQC15712.1 MAG: S-adenosylmethionine synthase [Firmicutes bacterium ADurb.Bin080]
MQKFFTSESVTEGHPDKVCDQIADAILDEFLKGDPESRVACEVAVTTGFVLIMGEITSKVDVDVEKVARETIKSIGYNRPELGFSGDTCEIKILLGKQSPDIALGVDNSLEHRETDEEYDRIGAGDQGIMFGYASDETASYMPMAIQLAHDLAKRLTEVRKKGIIPYLRPDGKTQVSIEYEGDKVKRVEAIVVSSQHNPEITMEVLRRDIKKEVIEYVVPAELLDRNTKYYINPTGRFVLGGPAGDSGITGRKIIVDTYGGYAAHGGGSFSGKDPTKVDRSATYFLRYVAKNIVAAGAAKRCEIQASYAIGKARPVSVSVNTYCSGIVSEEKIVETILSVFDLRPKAMIDKLQLSRPIYLKTASCGHFGRDSFPWERCDKVDEIKQYLGLK